MYSENLFSNSFSSKYLQNNMLAINGNERTIEKNDPKQKGKPMSQSKNPKYIGCLIIE